ncbi:MAG: HAD-IC family P-type ATPase, partial [Acholeplasmatales bacterium]|nr:HAD-IC family P-type ATPase [Acholeplasmatales bacterium]
KNIKKSKSNLYVSLRNILTFLVVIIVIIFILLFKSMSSHLLDSNAYPSIFQDPNYPELVKKISGAIVGMLPAGLLLCTSVSLAVGVIRLAKRNTLVQDEYSIETLARVDILCLDKTGTITDGTMTVHEVFEYKNPTNYALKQIMSAFINAQGEENSTTKALAERFGLAKKIKHCAIIPFSSQRKFSAVEFEKIGTFVLGASEFVLKENYNMIEREVERHSLDGYRVICLGFTKEHIVENTVEASVVPIALITIKDTIRPNAASIISYFKEIGVGIKVISGDNPMTVSKIAGRVGIDNYYSYISLDGLSDRDVERAASKYTIFGRVTPNQKKILVQTLKKEKHTVAMTGDGVNDILALREANVSIAMASGAEATRNVSNLVLMDSSFASLPKVVQEGRRVINNIQKVATLFLTKTIFSFILAIIGILKGYYPISPSQLYLIDYLVIGIPAFFLALENNNKVVSGNFIWNIFRSSIPGAIVVVIEALIIYAFSSANHFSDETLSTLIAVCTTFTCLMVLARISSPFNKLRGWLFLVMMTVCVLVLCFIPNLLGNIPFWSFKTISNGQSLGTIELLLMIALMEASLPLMLVVANLYKWIKTLIKVTITKLSDLGDVD